MTRKHNRYSYIDKRRLILMIVGAFSFMGVPSRYSVFVQMFLSFAAPAFYILSGYLVMRKSHHRSQRMLRTIRKTAIVFGILTVCYFLLNFATDAAGTLKTVTTVRFWIDFLALNIFALPIGGHLWYLQALLYGYLILYFIDKLNLFKFDWLIIGVCFAAAILTGDLAGVIGFRFMGHEYLMGNFITRAVPYLLIGKKLCDSDYQSKKEHKKTRIAIYTTAIGIVLLAAEAFVLVLMGRFVYYGHLVGHIFMAIGVTMFICGNLNGKFRSETLKSFSVYGTNWIYYLAQPVFAILSVFLIGRTSDASFRSGCLAVASVVFSIGVVLGVHKLRKLIKR